MTRWAKIDTRYMLNEKVRAASSRHRLAPLVHLAAILYSAENLTDGLADEAIVLATSKAPRVALTACIDAGLLTRVDGDTVRVHDYDDWQTPAGVVNETRRARSQAGRAGAEARWGTTNTAKWQNGKTHGKTHGKTMAKDVANEWLEYRTKNIELRERENEGGQTAPVPAAPSLSRFTIQLSEALRARSIPHRITPSWETTWQRLTATEGEAELDRLLTWALTEPSDFWATTCTTPARFEKNLDTIRAQAARQPRTTIPPTGSAPSGTPDRTPEPPPQMATEADRQAWRMTWIAHSRRGIPDDLATDYTNADLGITPTPGAEIISLRNYA